MSVHFGPRKPGFHAGGRNDGVIRVDMPETEAVLHAPQASETISTGTPVVRDMGEIPVYSGPTTVVPSLTEQVLFTRGKRMTDDVTVREVPYYEVSNESGLTVYIAGSLDD